MGKDRGKLLGSQSGNCVLQLSKEGPTISSTLQVTEVFKGHQESFLSSRPVKGTEETPQPPLEEMKELGCCKHRPHPNGSTCGWGATPLNNWVQIPQGPCPLQSLLFGVSPGWLAGSQLGRWPRDLSLPLPARFDAAPFL